MALRDYKIQEKNFPPKNEVEFIECGCCGHYHRTVYFGDCRNDAERFTFYELEDHYGQGEWVEIEETEF